MPLSGLFCPLLGPIPDEANNESMLGIVVLRGVELDVPLDRDCDSPGDGVSVLLLCCSCFTVLVAGVGAPLGPTLGGGVERWPFVA